MGPGGLLSNQSRQDSELQVERLASEKEKGKKRKKGRKKNGEISKEDISNPAFVLTWADGPACTHAL